MSLRDQLLKKGLVSKKQARDAERALKAERKQQQGNRRKKHLVRAETQAEQEAAREQAAAARRARRLERDEAKSQVERALQIRNLMLGNRVAARGSQPFWHRSASGEQLLRMSVSLGVAEQLRRGELCIAAFDHGNRIEYLVIRVAAADRLEELGSKAVVFRVRDLSGISAPEEHFLVRTWETDLRPHRHRAAADRPTASGAGPRTGA